MDHMLQKVTGIVLHTIKYNDTSSIVEMYTDVYGRASFLIPVSRSRKSSVRSTIFQPLSVIEFETNIQAKSSLSRIREAKSHIPYRNIPYDPYKSAITLFLAEFLYRAVREESENRPLFAYILHSVSWLDESNGSFSNFHLVFLMRLSRFLGLYPNLDDYHEGAYFDLINGSFTSVKPLSHRSFIVPEEAARLNMLMRMNYDTMHLFGMTRQERSRCLAIINDYYRLHIPGFPELKSLSVLQELFD